MELVNPPYEAHPKPQPLTVGQEAMQRNIPHGWPYILICQTQRSRGHVICGMLSQCLRLPCAKVPTFVILVADQYCRHALHVGHPASLWCCGLHPQLGLRYVLAPYNNVLCILCCVGATID
eukprot:105160-Pelagomonas_calceolata.AAC.2